MNYVEKIEAILGEDGYLQLHGRKSMQDDELVALYLTKEFVGQFSKGHKAMVWGSYLCPDWGKPENNYIYLNRLIRGGGTLLPIIADRLESELTSARTALKQDPGFPKMKIKKGIKRWIRR